VAVLLGDGAGALGPPTNYETGVLAYSIRAADLNLDGKLDLVTGEVQYVSVFLGNGDGTFQPQSKVSTGATASIQVEVGDVNGDGKPDLVTAQNDADESGNWDSASLLLGNGDGTFQPATIYVVGNGGANDVALGDLDGDGKDEITVGGYWGHELHVFYSTDGRHDVYHLERTWGHTLVDLNEDGHLDVVSGGLTFSIAVMLNNGDGTLQPARYTQAADGYTFYPRSADFNRDGKADMAMANSSYPTVSTLLGNGDGSFKPFQSYPYGAIGNYLAPGDLNNDYYPDLVVGGDTGVVVMLNDRKWAGSGHRPPLAGPPFSDINRDPTLPLPPAPDPFPPGDGLSGDHPNEEVLLVYPTAATLRLQPIEAASVPWQSDVRTVPKARHIEPVHEAPYAEISVLTPTWLWLFGLPWDPMLDCLQLSP
jgi:hypothetical protein